MIRNETEYKEALKRLAEDQKFLEAQEKHFKNAGYSGEKLEFALAPTQTFHQQLREEVQAYEKLKRGEIGDFYNLEGVGRTLVALRIARGLTQKDLSERLAVHETQVSRDERNEYRGVTVEKVTKILNALNVKIISQVETPVLPEDISQN